MLIIVQTYIHAHTEVLSLTLNSLGSTVNVMLYTHFDQRENMRLNTHILYVQLDYNDSIFIAICV